MLDLTNNLELEKENMAIETLRCFHIIWFMIWLMQLEDLSKKTFRINLKAIFHPLAAYTFSAN